MIALYYMENVKFISVDWGTSNFRLNLVNYNLNVVKTIQTNNGIKSIAENLNKINGNRVDIFLNYIKNQLKKIEIFNNSIPIIISGMASSSIGIEELPYVKIPISINANNLIIKYLPNSILTHPIILVSGIKSQDDVMRGEEIQLLGLYHDLKIKEKCVFVFPGTHCKHIYCENGLLTNFKTHMTGEMFDIICNHSILSGSISTGLLNASAIDAFKHGVNLVNTSNSILNTLFSIRTNTLFGHKDNKENFYILSGLLIGEELSAINTKNQIVLCAENSLYNLYKLAISQLGLSSNTIFVEQEKVKKSVIMGHNQVFKILEL